MKRAIVTIKKYQETYAQDLDIPVELDAIKLAEIVVGALGWEQDPNNSQLYKINARSLGRFLKRHESLVSAGVDDGEILTFFPPGVSPPETDPESKSASPPTSSRGPVTGWRDLNLENTDTKNQSAQTKDKPNDRDDNPFVWKEIDT